MSRRLPSLNGAGPKSKGGPLPPIRLQQESVGVIDGLESSSRPSALPSLPAIPQAPPSSDVRPKKRTKEARRDKSVRQPLAPLQTGPPAPSGSVGIKTSRPLVLPGLLPQLDTPSCKKEVPNLKKKKKKKNLQPESRPDSPGNIVPPDALPSNPVRAAKPVVKPSSHVMMCPHPPGDRPRKTARRPPRQKLSHPVGTSKPDERPSSTSKPDVGPSSAVCSVKPDERTSSTLCSSKPDEPPSSAVCSSETGRQSSSPLLVMDDLELDLPNSCFDNVMLFSMPEFGQAEAAVAPAKEVSPSPPPVVPTGPLLTKRAEKNAPKHVPPLVPAPPPARSCLLPALDPGSVKRRKVKVRSTTPGLSGPVYQRRFMLP